MYTWAIISKLTPVNKTLLSKGKMRWLQAEMLTELQDGICPWSQQETMHAIHFGWTVDLAEQLDIQYT